MMMNLANETWKPIQQIDMNRVFDVLLHEGVTKYRTKSSKATLPEHTISMKHDKLSKKGAIFVVRKKEDFTDKGVRGYIVTSKETLLNDAAALSHFTPNIYRKFTYKDEKRRYITGFEEQNLLQINTFGVDIDTKEYTPGEILMTCLDDSIGIPTLMVETPRGYQLQFALTEPMFVSDKNDYRILTIAKRIAENIKISLKNVNADRYCNSFGFFRVPTPANIIHAQFDSVFSFFELMNWSMAQDTDNNRPLYVIQTKQSEPFNVTQSDWFQALVSTVDLKGDKGQIGRNNTLFTLALVCLQDNWSEERTYDFLDEYNSRLTYPLKNKAIKTIISSAYSGKYHGAAKEYIETLLDTYIPKEQFDVKLRQSTWYKFKKERKDRKNSHFDEWENDLIQYLTANFDESEPFIWRTQKQICEEIGIPQSSLNVLIKNAKQLVKTVIGKGRNSKTGWTTISLFKKHILYHLQLMKADFTEYIQSMINQYFATQLDKKNVPTLLLFLDKIIKKCRYDTALLRLDISG